MIVQGILTRSVASSLGASVRQQQLRFAWQAVLTKYRDQRTGEYKYRDWNDIMRGAKDPMKGTKTLLDIYDGKKRHTKRTTLKKQLKERIHYENKLRQIDDLSKYIKFMKDHPNEFRNGRPT